MQFDFLVVGAGMAGASIAYQLARTRRVCLLEGEKAPGFHSTGRSAALFAPTYGGRAIRAVTRASRPFFDEPPPGFAAHALLAERGCLYIARDDQRESLATLAQEISASGGHLQPTPAADAARRVPLLRRDYVAEAIFDAGAMDIDVHALHQGFLRGARAAGTTLVTDAWLERIERRAGLWRLEAHGETVEAPVLINAAGAWADPLAALCGATPLGLQPLRRTALLVEPPGGIAVKDWPAVIDADELFYFKPDAGNLLLSPADETPTPAVDAQPEDWDVAVAVDRVQQALDIDVQRVLHRWAGLRTFAPDRAPVVGFDSVVDGLFWCAGQGGYGIQTAPALSRMAAALAQGEGVPADVAAEGVSAADLAPARLRGGAAAN